MFSWGFLCVFCCCFLLVVGVKGPVGRCKATTPCPLSLASNRLTTNCYCRRQTTQLVAGMCAHDRRVLYQLAVNVHVKTDDLKVCKKI